MIKEISSESVGIKLICKVSFVYFIKQQFFYGQT